MSENTKIEWCDATFNPWIGCTKISPGCDGCYAATQDKFRGWTPEGWGGPRKRTKTWGDPKKWEKAHTEFFAQHGRRRRVFCASLADVFDNQVPPEWRADLFELIRTTPNLDWLLLTKRPQNIAHMVRESGAIAGNGMRFLPDNVRLGTTVEDQKRADQNIPALLRTIGEIGARSLFLSVEPMLGPVDVFSTITGELLHTSGNDFEPGWINWVICGGESGHGARPMHPDWARSLRDQCVAAGVPLLFKQWGEWLPISQTTEEFTNRLYKSRRTAKLHEVQAALDDCYGRNCIVESGVVHHDGSLHGITEPMAFQQGTGSMQTFKVGKKAAGRLLDGIEHNGFPA